jgi:hypothetical protein
MFPPYTPLVFEIEIVDIIKGNGVAAMPQMPQMPTQ